MAYHRLIPRMTLAALLAAGPLTPAVAQDRAMLEFLLVELADPTNSKVLRAAAAACMLGDGQVDAIAAPLVAAGWTRSDDDEMGMVALYPATGSVGVSLYDEGRICDVASEAWGTDIALTAVQIMSAASGLSPEPMDGECMAFRLTPTFTVDITSTGQDPVCQSDTTSSLRFTYAGAN